MSDRVEWNCEGCGNAIDDGAGGLFVELGHWHAAHGACREAKGKADHSVPVVELRTEVEVIHATAHLLETGWLGATDWFQVLLNVTDRGGKPVST